MVILAIWIASAIAAIIVGTKKGRAGAGWLLGICLGLIGLFIVAVLPAKNAKTT